MKYKTKNNVSPQGKPRVYFCCHPADFEKHFESISNDILKNQNCTVWYSDEEINRDEDFFISLKQMQLFVMPITTNLLCTENATLDIDFKFAVKNHIPVLPLMMEYGLEELFNKKCGELQFLDKNNTDSTAISYNEKLEKYLSAVLIGDELAGKIRAAFDAYVFLSYRKKDRKYAQELMKLIHKNDFCRDIAIWYDEFLTPGENFNDSIKDAIQKSGLFVLAVTPNIVNETNYIMTTEYPMAKQSNKPILPAELVPTDRNLLFDKYEDIPTPTDAHNATELSEALLESIKKMAIKENDDSPEHNFFIGLAYLSGIDVEVDHERAIELITSAADAGLEEAFDKLSDMYLNGIGVERNLEKSVFWLERRVEMCHDRFIENDTEYNLMGLCNSISSLCNFYLRTLNDINRGLIIYQRYCHIIENAEPPKTFEAKRVVGLFFLEFGDCCLDIDDMASAEKYLISAETMLVNDAVMKIEKFNNSISNVELFKTYTVTEWNEYIASNNDLSLIYESLGILYKHKCVKDKYEEYLLKTFELRKTTCKYIKGDYKSDFNLIVAYYNIAAFYIENKQYANAENFISEGSELALQLANESGSLHAGEVWVKLINLNATMHCARNDFESAKNCYLRCIIALKNSKKTPKLTVLLAENYILLSEVLMITDEIEDVPDLLNESNVVLSDAGITNDRLNKHINILIKELSEKPKFLQTQLQLVEQMVKKYSTKISIFSTDRELHEKFVNFLILGNMYFKLEMYDKAETVYLLCIKIGKKLMKSDTKKQYAEAQLYLLYKNLSNVYVSLSKNKDAETYIKQFIDFGHKISKKGKSDVTTKVNISVLNDCGLIYQKMNNIKKAKKCFASAIDLMFKLMITDESEDTLDLAAEILFNDAVADKTNIDMLELKNARSLWIDLAKKHPDIKKYAENVECIDLLLPNCDQ